MRNELQNYKIARLQNPSRSQRGYVMITLMLALALITIGFLSVLPEISQQIRRDREEEMIHRGSAYMRAIQHFYKKFGRYPSRVEELENTNNLRFLRKRYTDPLNRDPATGKEREFKLLHQQDVALNNGPVMPGQPGAPGIGGGPTQPGGPSQPGGFSSQPGGFSQPGGSPQASPNGDAENSSNGPGGSNSPGSSASKDDDSNSGSPLSGPTFGGGPILGVASTSKDKTIRVFFDKTKYKDWLFVYVPGMERGGLLTGPVNPNQPPGGGLFPGQTAPNIPGGPGTPTLPTQPNGSLSSTPPPTQSSPGPTTPQQ